MPGGGGDILVLNCGSSSIKFAVFDRDLNRRHSGEAERIGGTALLSIDDTSRALQLRDHRAALQAILSTLEGGYSLEGLPRCVAAHLTGLLEYA